MKITTALLAAVLIAVTVVDGKIAFRQGIKVTQMSCIAWPDATTTTAAEYIAKDLTKSEFGLCSSNYPNGWLDTTTGQGKVRTEGLRPLGLLPAIEGGNKDICNNNKEHNPFPCCGSNNRCVDPPALLKERLGGEKFKTLLNTEPAKLVEKLLQETEDKETAEAKAVSDAKMACCSLSSAGRYNSDRGGSDGDSTEEFIWQTRGECEETKKYRAKHTEQTGAQVVRYVANEADCAAPAGCGLLQLEKCSKETVGECYITASYLNFQGKLSIDDASEEKYYSADQQYFVKLDPTSPENAKLCSANGTDSNAEAQGRTRFIDTAADNGMVIGPLIGMGVIVGNAENDRRDHMFSISLVEDGKSDVGKKEDKITGVIVGDGNTELAIALEDAGENTRSALGAIGSTKKNEWLFGIGGSAEPIWIINVKSKYE